MYLIKLSLTEHINEPWEIQFYTFSCLNVRWVSIFSKFPLGMLTIPGYLRCLQCTGFMFYSSRMIHFNYKQELQFLFDSIDISCPLRVSCGVLKHLSHSNNTDIVCSVLCVGIIIVSQLLLCKKGVYVR